MTLPTAAAGKWRGSKQTEAADRGSRQDSDGCSPISSAGSEMRNIQRRSSSERARGGDRVSGGCHYPASGFFAAEKRKWFAEVKEPPRAVIPLRGKKICSDFPASAFSNFYMLAIFLPPPLHHSHNSSLPCPFWQ